MVPRTAAINRPGTGYPRDAGAQRCRNFDTLLILNDVVGEASRLLDRRDSSRRLCGMPLTTLAIYTVTRTVALDTACHSGPNPRSRDYCTLQHRAGRFRFAEALVIRHAAPALDRRSLLDRPEHMRRPAQFRGGATLRQSGSMHHRSLHRRGSLPAYELRLEPELVHR